MENKTETVSENEWYSFQFWGGSVFVKIDNRWRMVHRNEDIIRQNWRMRAHKYGEDKPNPKKTYRMKIPNGFKLTECTDQDCPINGCKYAACYWADYLPIEKIYIANYSKT